MATETGQERKSGFGFLKLIMIVFILLVIYFLMYGTDQLWRWVYPLKYQNLILENASRFDLDPYFIASIIYVESHFNPEAVSHKGARGLMQIMPETGRWIASELGENTDREFKETDLFLPERNIYYGSWYLNSLKKQFSDQRTIVLAAYNAGRGNVSNWLKGDWDGRKTTLTDLPFAETRDFVKRVEHIYQIYSKIYQAELGD